MGYHVLAFTGSNAANQTNLDTPGVYDGFAPLQNNHYIYPENSRVVLAYANGLGLARARINTPYNRQVSLPYITPINAAAAVPNLPPLARFGHGGPYIPKLDEIGIDATTDATAGPNRDTIGLFLHDGDFSVGGGNIVTIRGAAAIVSTTLVWSAGTITFDQTLPYGRYEIIGMDCIGANLVFARLLFAEGGKRPGVLARTALTLAPFWDFREGNMGVLGQFDSTAPPSLEVWSIGAGSTQEVYLDVRKIR